MKRLITALLCLTGFAFRPALAQPFVSALSDQQIAIDSRFSGKDLTLFGNVELVSGADQTRVARPYDIVIAIVGPPADRVVRRQGRRFGLWVNVEHATFKQLPTFLHILASRPLDAITDTATLRKLQLTPTVRALAAADPGNSDKGLFSRELVRLMDDKGYFGIDARGVRFLSKTFYTARVAFPADVPNGRFKAETYLFDAGKIVGHHDQTFVVSKIGFERLVGSAADEFPWLYGIAAILVAMGMGSLGGVLFRR